MNQIDKAVSILRSGGIIAYPTDTVYGLGADIFNQEAIKKVFQLKQRNFKKPLSIAVSDFKMMETVVKLSGTTREVVKKLLPGPITVILPKKKLISPLITAGSKLVGVRLPQNKLATEIISKAKFPIITTSANISGRKEVVKATDLYLQVDFVVIGKCRYKKPSTVVDLVHQTIVRKGAGFERVQRVLASAKID